MNLVYSRQVALGRGERASNQTSFTKSINAITPPQVTVRPPEPWRKALSWREHFFDSTPNSHGIWNRVCCEL